MATPKKFYATRDFKDAGIEKAFKLGDELTSEPGVENYAAAGLASDEKPADPAPADKLAA
jgi:hypothetical protein